jgi:prolyl-tRNA synthetase
MSKLFSQTIREVPSEADIPSHQLLLRAGFIRQLAAGIFSYLPLARRSLTKVENIMRDEIEAIGGQEITMPVIHPAEVWQETERWYQIGSEMGRFKDKSGRDMVLSMTHEEVIGDLVRKEIHTYRQLPQLLYHIQIKWRDDPRPRGGLIRVREFTMKDSYSLDKDWEGLDQQYRSHYQVYFNIFNRCALPTIAVNADMGMMGGKVSHEYMYLTSVGEDSLLLCDSCGYAANRQVAIFRKTPPQREEVKSLEKISTPDTKTIEDLAKLLDIPESKTAKAVFMIAKNQEDTKTDENLIFAVIRGDMELNETKLANAVKAIELRAATDDEIIAIGAVPGYASPINLTDTIIIVDDMIPESPNLVAGANEEGYHLKNVNYGRDYQAEIVTDIVSAKDGYECKNCSNKLHLEKGIEVGNIFQLGTRYSEAMGCYFLDKDGESKPVLMGSYGIGSGRLLASIAEEHHDEFGLIWPITVAPYHVYLVSISGKITNERNIDITTMADQLYQELIDGGIEVLYDDRDERPGVKFNDADLIGIPFRLTISPRSVENGGIEVKMRNENERRILPIDEVITWMLSEKARMEREITSNVKEMSYIG